MVKKQKPLIALLTNNDDDIYCFRKELIDGITGAGYDILISCPYGEKFELMKEYNYIYDDPFIDRRGTNIVSDAKLFLHYLRLFKEYKPDVVLTYTAKPGVYGSIAARMCGISYINNVTGFGSVLNKSGLMRKFIMGLFKFAYRGAACVMFQNSTNMKLAQEIGMVKGECKLIPGSGVALDRYPVQPYPDGGNGITGEPVRFNYFGRILHFVTSILYTVAALLILPFIKLYTHGVTDIEYVIPSFALLFCLAGAIRQFQIPASVMIGAAGKFKEVRSSVVYSAVICIALGVPGAIYFGLPGVMFAMVCAVLGRTAFTTWYINKIVVKRGIEATCKRLGTMLMATVIAVTPFMTFITIEPQSFVAWLAWGIGMFVWVSIVHLVFAYLFEKNTVSQLLDRILTSVGIKVKK